MLFEISESSFYELVFGKELGAYANTLIWYFEAEEANKMIYE